MTAAVVFDLGVGRFHIGGSPAECPPRIHLYDAPHDHPIGGSVPASERSGEPVLTLIFHNPEALEARQEALRITRTWFPINNPRVM